jgi:alpha-tubulin suppressor-like RCC1 family protein
MSALRSVVLAASLGLVLEACPDATGPHPASLAITPRLASLALGDSAQLTATVSDRGGAVLTGAVVTWSSADTAVLTVSPSGLARARGPGRTTVFAGSAGANDMLSVTVTIRFVQVAGAWGGLCAIASTGAAYCRGGGMKNANGQLGNGTTIPSDTFVPVAGGHRFLTVQPGELATCGLAADSTAWCWGSGEYGSLGTGDTLDHATPTAVSGGWRFVTLAVGELHACGVTLGGSTLCWGLGYSGQNGDSGLANRLSPAPVPGAPTFVGLGAAGEGSTCGVTAAHAGWCWGDNSGGKLGAYTDTIFHDPVAVTGGRTFQKLDLRGGYCGLTTDGEAICWGRPWLGPPPPPSGQRFIALGTGEAHACGVGSDSTVYCWGYGKGAQGVTHGVAFTDVAVGYKDDCALAADGTAYCWMLHCGADFDVGCNQPPAPVAVPAASSPFVRISPGQNDQTCAIAADGTAWCWYWMTWLNRAETPVMVPGGILFRSVAVGFGTLGVLSPYDQYACGLAADSTAYCWSTRDLGTSTRVSAPVPVPGGLKFVSLDVLSGQVCGIGLDRGAYCWKPGDASPRLVAAGRAFASIFASWDSDCALTTDGAAFCWGRNTYGELGLGFESRQAIEPVQVLGGHAFSTVVPGDLHSCGLATDGAAWCWGANWYGGLGTGDSTSSTEPVAVAGGLRFVSLVTGFERTCGLTADGSAYCWGSYVLTPTLRFPGTHFSSLTVDSPYGTCGVTTAGDIVCESTTAATARMRVHPLPQTSRRPSPSATPPRPRH